MKPVRNAPLAGFVLIKFIERRNDIGTKTTGFMHGADLEQMVKDAETPAILNGFSDLICPHCNLNILTPAGRVVKAGTGRCPRCKKPFDVTVDIAEKANHSNIEGCFLRAVAK